MKSGIYLITNVINGRVYVGKDIKLPSRKYRHWSQLKRGIHDNNHLQNAWTKYGEKAFHYEILMYCLVEDLVYWEDWWMEFFDSLNPDKGYNLVKSDGTEKSEETRIKMSIALKGKPWSEARRAAYTPGRRTKKSSSLKGKPKPPRSEESKAKQSASRKGTLTGENNPAKRPEVRAKISASKKGKPGHPKSEEIRKKISANSRSGTPEVKARISVAQVGHIVSEETRAKISSSLKGKPKTKEHKANLLESKKDWVVG